MRERSQAMDPLTLWYVLLFLGMALIISTFRVRKIENGDSPFLGIEIDSIKADKRLLIAYLLLDVGMIGMYSLVLLRLKNWYEITFSFVFYVFIAIPLFKGQRDIFRKFLLYKREKKQKWKYNFFDINNSKNDKNIFIAHILMDIVILGISIVAGFTLKNWFEIICYLLGFVFIARNLFKNQMSIFKKYQRILFEKLVKKKE